MWVSISIAVIVLALAVVAASRRTALRLRGFLLVGIALLLTIGIDALIGSDTIWAGRGSELMGIAIILLAAWAIWKLPGPRHDGGGR
jgi:hypothetical protein